MAGELWTASSSARASTTEDIGPAGPRVEVFFRKQGVPDEEELDALDQMALHADAWDRREVARTLV